MSVFDADFGGVRMKEPTRTFPFTIVFAVTVFVSLAAGQGTTPSGTIGAIPLNPLRLPLPLQVSVAALGTRLQTPGNERGTLSGTLANSTGSSPATVIYELPNKLRINLMGTSGGSIGSDGSANWASGRTINEQDEDLLETFAEDSPEGMLHAILKTASVRLIATHALMEGGQTPNPPVDIYQVVGPVQSSAAKTVRQKHFYFDSGTHLLIEVDYLLTRSNGSTAGVRVQRSHWTTAGGQMVPGAITRLENGKIIASFTTTSAAFSPAAADGMFSHP
jgi:hypothetical protein